MIFTNVQQLTDSPSKHNGGRSPAKRLVVVLPALNEAASISQVIESIPRAMDGISDVRIVVVDDGSSDRTAELAAEAGAVVVSHRRNCGVGEAFATGIDQALRLGADIIVNMDADGQFSPRDIRLLIAPILHDGLGFVTCTRFGDANKVPEMPRLKLWGNRMMCRLINAITGGPGFTDVACGFRAYSRDTALRLNLYGSFTYTQESLIDLVSKNVAMTEVPLVVRGEREYGKSRVASNLWRYGFRTLTIILRTLRDWRPLTFFGSIALIFMAIGFGLVGFVGVWWLSTSQTSPWTSLITLGGTSFVMGIGFAVLALIADQIGRGRRIQEQLLYLHRKNIYGEKHESRPQSMPVSLPTNEWMLENVDSLT